MNEDNSSLLFTQIYNLTENKQTCSTLVELQTFSDL